MTNNKLSKEDMKRVEQFLNTPVNQVERQPFKPMKLLLIITLVVVGFGLLSRLIAWLYVNSITS
ncbi:DUF3094 family protein [Spartinivicinus poritis]|uniref:DUF3094 family protein n=1 Tax=Spartinivicinus poritis TaxID=2994640 RepID=A0ABT5U8K6_9GAMM|nr:DUF3094 family protein [Spartinivicinus sp. A2-2]MDE1462712.1 DUF3094 family protein [Spartinivicinus sp. A2-2]